MLVRQMLVQAAGNFGAVTRTAGHAIRTAQTRPPQDHDLRTARIGPMKVALNLLLILVASLLCLFAVEGLTRLVLDDGMLYELEMWKYAREVKMRDMRPDLGHRHRPNAQAKLMNVDVRTNSRGLRGAEIAGKPADGTARIAFVGDSITMGWGVAERETFAHQ